ncbi:alcohol dehydrogenase catalytic domain-containing protein [Pyrobaculum ferrireducens]|uniref:Alcohol dehydrogenase (Zinc) n=1 Tax=Pyrobaculum ferrireducens TaxID=1104324 RepID=G7VHL7_9CREN|nr:alcohol dehydrogenase catalytic domain-containing protein [Pyrobaculum ferrireducens]AET33308.1 alcohol dehydrogenase (Zinc) [Pyrobaculum ferrireducens]
MKAAVFSTPGLENLSIQDVEAPRPGPGEVLIKVRHAGANPLDYNVVTGAVKATPMPHIPGSEFAGVVEEVGPGVEGLQRGDAVVVYNRLYCGHCRHCLAGWTQMCESTGGALIGVATQGGYAEYAVVPARNVEKTRAELREAATLPIGGLTAWNMAYRAGISPGERVAVVGATGNVGVYAVQFAKLLGGEVYAVTRRKDMSAPVLKSIGADYVVTPDEAREAAPFDVVLDPTGAGNWELSYSLLGRMGRYVTAGALTGAEVKLDLRRLYGMQISVIGSTGGRRGDFKLVVRLLESGRIKAVIYKTYGLAEARRALEELRSGDRVGKVLVAI